MKAARAPRGRAPLYFATNVVFLLLVAAGAALGPAGNPRLLYLCALFAVCSSPILYADKLNGRYMLLCVFTPLYFFFYGAADLLDLFVPSHFTSLDSGLLTLAEVAVLLGVSMLVGSYRVAVWIYNRRKPPRMVKDWPKNSLLMVGLAIWTVGLIANWIWQIDIQRRAFARLQELSNLQSMVLMAARLMHPLGTVLVAYCLVKYKSRPLLLLVLGMLAAEVMVGFIGDSKELALRGIAIVVLVKCLLEGRVSKVWVGSAALFVVIAFPIFQAYRAEVLSHNADRGKAAANLSENIDKALNSNKLDSGDANYSSRSFLTRTSLKPTMELILQKVGDTAPYQEGYTIALTAMGLVPRALWPEKPDTSTGQLFNRELHISGFRDVYVSVSQLGEWYWNFGWLGIMGGMTFIGLLLGFVNSRCDLSEAQSVTRLVMIAVTAYLICVRFEDNIAMTFIQWLRSLVAIGVLHLMFARLRIVLPQPPTRTARDMVPPVASPSQLLLRMD